MIIIQTTVDDDKKAKELNLENQVKFKLMDYRELDEKYYQTVFAKNAGAVASPTAGLHFNKNLMQDFKKKNKIKSLFY